VIPKAVERKITFDRGEFLSAARRVFIVAKQNPKRQSSPTKGDLLEMTAESQEVGRAYEEVPISMDGENLTIAFNTRYLIEALGIISDRAGHPRTFRRTQPRHPARRRTGRFPLRRDADAGLKEK
jgi:DNA polymerase-3 subunit beta